MKDIKSYVIGFLTCACLFLIMGHMHNANRMHRHHGEWVLIPVSYYNSEGEVVKDEKVLTDYLEDLDVQNRNMQNDIIYLESRISDLEKAK